VHQATLLFVIVDRKVLLIRKKRGLGAGKINGPGGKLDAGETPQQCALREVSEELCIDAINPQSRGELRFQFIDDYSIHVHVFVADQYRGEPTETDEAIPLWYDIADVPYTEMWADDRVWLPAVLEDSGVDGRFTFDGDKLLEYDVVFSSQR
jgi:8-oxo-dGTP diphosphatase